MQFRRTALADVQLIELEPMRDERGFFARTFCADEFARQRLETRFVQNSLSHTERAGSIRGLHFQSKRHEEVKVVHCVKGAIHDVLIDLRVSSRTYLKWEAYQLTADNRRQLYVPAGFAHGFQTLLPDTEVSYQISAFYAPTAARGVRYDDPAFAIVWPQPVTVVSTKDQAWPDFRPG